MKKGKHNWFMKVVSIVLALCIFMPTSLVHAAGSTATGETIEIYNSGETMANGGGKDLVNQDFGSPNFFAPVKFKDPSKKVTSAQIVIYGFDVDAPQEEDKVYINDHYVGMLSGMNQEWNTTTLDITGDALKSLSDGKENNIRMETNSGWIVYIRSMNLIINGGGSNDFDTNDMKFDVKFDGTTVKTDVTVDPTKDGTYYVEYAVKELDEKGNPIKQLASSSEQITFTANKTEQYNKDLTLIESPTGNLRVDFVIKNNIQVPVVILTREIFTNAKSDVVIQGGSTIDKGSVAVGDIDAIAQTLKSKTPGSTTEVTFTVKENPQAANAADVLKQMKKDGKTAGIILDMDLNKIVKDADGKVIKSESGAITETSSLIEVELTLPKSLLGMKEYVVYRYHGQAVDAITMTPNQKGEYIELSTDGTKLKTYCNQFSTYVIGYVPKTVEQEKPVVDDEPQTGGVAGMNGMLFAAIVLLSCGGIITYKLKKSVK